MVALASFALGGSPESLAVGMPVCHRMHHRVRSGRLGVDGTHSSSRPQASQRVIAGMSWLRGVRAAGTRA
jgi:hypothetical protein